MISLNPEKLAQISLELHSFEISNNDSSGWDSLYPNLYTLLNTLVTEVSAQSRWGVPTIAVQFKGNESDSINGYCIHDGTIQLNFGAALLKKLLLEEAPLEAAPHDVDAAYEELTTLVSQELEQTCDEMIGKAALELDAYEKSSGVSNWNIIYPHLFTMLWKIISPLCVKTGQPVSPPIAIMFASKLRYNAMAMVFSNGVEQLNIGSELIRELIFNADPENKETRFRQFQWVIAHEIGHFIDPAFQTYARWGLLVKGVNIVSQSLLLLGLNAPFLPMIYSSSFIAAAPTLATIGSLGLLIPACIKIFLHRKFEYAADAMTTQLLENFTPNEVEQALTFMDDNIKNDFFGALQLAKKNAFSLLYRKIVWTYLSRLHPSRKKRIEALEQIILR